MIAHTIHSGSTHTNIVCDTIDYNIINNII